jgi:thiamine-phosphate pyrophosphorylase
VRAHSNVCKPHRPIELYVILDEGLVGSTGIESVLEAVIQGGADAVQFRAKRLSKRSYYEIAIRLASIFSRNESLFFVNDHFDVALALSVDGIHLGQNDLPCTIARRLAPPELIIGTSTHSLEEADRAATDEADYIAIGSVFPTSTKENPEAIVGTEIVGTVKERVGDIPLIAIGGINAENVGDVIRAGADGVAVASGVILADDPCAAARELKEKIRAAREARN